MYEPTKIDCQIAAQVLKYLSEHIMVPAQANEVVKVVNSMLRSTCKNAQRIVETFIPDAKEDILN